MSRKMEVFNYGEAQLQQHVGRLHRLHHNKRLVQVYDYVDEWVPMLERMYERRMEGYGAIGYTIEHEIPQQLLDYPSTHRRPKGPHSQ